MMARFDLRKAGALVLCLGLFLSPVRALKAQEAAPAGGQQPNPAASTPGADPGEKDESESLKHSKMVNLMGHALGLSTDAAATTFEVLNFAILAVAVGGLLWKTMPKIFRDRTSTIQKELSDARSATEQASVRLNSVEERLAKLDVEILAMKSKADADAVLEEQRFRAAAEDEKAKILAAAEQEILSATEQAQRQLRQYAAGLAIDQAARKLVITAEMDRLLVRSFAERLGSGKDGVN